MQFLTALWLRFGTGLLDLRENVLWCLQSCNELLYLAQKLMADTLELFVALGLWQLLKQEVVVEINGEVSQLLSEVVLHRILSNFSNESLYL